MRCTRKHPGSLPSVKAAEEWEAEWEAEAEEAGWGE